MERNMFKKVLVVGIIFLFIGVGVQPVFARDTIKTTISETLEDCECQPVSNHNFDRLEKLSIRTNRLLNRAKIFTNIVGILSKNNPEISKEKFVELSNRITKLKTINEKQLLTDKATCDALVVKIFTLLMMCRVYGMIAKQFEKLGFDGIADMFYQMCEKTYSLFEDYADIFKALGCEEFY